MLITVFYVTRSYTALVSGYERGKLAVIVIAAVMHDVAEFCHYGIRIVEDLSSVLINLFKHFMINWWISSLLAQYIRIIRSPCNATPPEVLIAEFPAVISIAHLIIHPLNYSVGEKSPIMEAGNALLRVSVSDNVNETRSRQHLPVYWINFARNWRTAGSKHAYGPRHADLFVMRRAV